MSERRAWHHVVKDISFGFGSMLALPFAMRALTRVPHGDHQHPVLILPGFMASDPWMCPLHRYLSRIGYRSYPWLLGVNLGYSYVYDIEELILRRIRQVLEDSGRPSLTLIGWSLGGIYAKALARKHPELIRDVIIMGSAVSGDVTNVALFSTYEWLTGMGDGGTALSRKLRELSPPLEGVPITSIYSGNDGLVPIANAVHAEGPLVQNVHVRATHVGMPYDPFVYFLIAHRLAQSSVVDWKPLDVEALRHSFITHRSWFRRKKCQDR